ncbi:MAG: hypothetical protein QGF59_01610 [Pirellulaceae bacterium]|nr:hypothetical protein [Pirellulaceae bacterium]
MSLEPYQICPCGSGDKVKFCCSKDIVPELDKVLRAVEGEQRASALDQIEKLVAEKGERLALLALKADLQLSLGGVDAAENTIAAFQKAAPYNSVALALSAIVAASKSDVEAASEKLQRSLEYVDKEMPQSVYAAIGLIGRLMLSRGNVLAARGHWILQASLAGGQDQDPVTLLTRLNASPEIPLLLKEDHAYAECPADVPWAGEFNAALKSARRGAWLAARESLESLTAKVTDHPALVKNIAIFRGWLGETEEAVAAWHKYASMDGVDQDDAIEAEALAQMLDAKTYGDEVDEITVTFAVPDIEKLMEWLLAHKQLSQMHVDLQQLAQEDQPPPKAVSSLLDRPMPETGVGLKREDIPCVVADMMVYGKQTDRDARVELVLLKTDGFDARSQLLADLAGELVGEVVKEEKTGSASVIAEALTWRWRLPNDTPTDLRTEFLSAQHRDVMLQRWTTLPQQVLDGKSPIDAASDDAYRVRLLAIILLLELAADPTERDFDFDELRTKLGIPTRPMISGKNQDVLKLSMVQLTRINGEELEDEQLYIAFQRAALKNQTELIFSFGQEMLKRDRLPKGLEKNQLYEALINACSDSDVALELVAEADAIAAEKNESPARWLLAELSVRLPRMESDQCNRLVQTIQSRHMNEPGVADGLYRLLVNYGVISPDGTPAGGGPAPQQAAAPTAGAPEGGGLWTPDGPATPAGDESQKSKLWVPGMD